MKKPAYKPANTGIHRLIILFSILILSLSACAGAAATPMAAPEQARAPAAEAPAGAPAPSYSDSTSGFTQSKNSLSQPSVTYSGANDTSLAVNRIVIKNANLTIVVDDPKATMENISKMAEDMGGFVVNANLTHNTLESGAEVPHATVVVRVPAGRLNDALTQIQKQSKRAPLSMDVSSQDVTKDYTDLQSRLTALQAEEAQLKEIMGSATKTEDVLNVYNQLAQVQSQIEQVKGQIRYYDESAALSLITVDVLANEAVQPLTVGGWQPAGVAKDAVQALIYAVKFLVNAGIWIILFVLPVALLILLPLYVIFRLIRRWLSRRRKPLPPPQPAD